MASDISHLLLDPHDPAIICAVGESSLTPAHAQTLAGRFAEDPRVMKANTLQENDSAEVKIVVEARPDVHIRELLRSLISRFRPTHRQAVIAYIGPVQDGDEIRVGIGFQFVTATLHPRQVEFRDAKLATIQAASTGLAELAWTNPYSFVIVTSGTMAEMVDEAQDAIGFTYCCLLNKFDGDEPLTVEEFIARVRNDFR